MTQTDGYSGAPGLWCQNSKKIFYRIRIHLDICSKRLNQKGLTEDDALLNARLAKILTADDYDEQRTDPLHSHRFR